MTDTPQDSAAPLIKPKRPIYRSYGELIRTLIADARKRVMSTKHVEVPPPDAPPAAKRLAHAILVTAVKLRKLERTLSEHYHMRVAGDSSYRQSEKIEWTYEHHRKLEGVPSKKYTARIEQINALKVQATLDTIDMTPKQAKQYLLKLQQQLAKI